MARLYRQHKRGATCICSRLFCLLPIACCLKNTIFAENLKYEQPFRLVVTIISQNEDG